MTTLIIGFIGGCFAGPLVAKYLQGRIDHIIKTKGYVKDDIIDIPEEDISTPE